MIGRRLLPLLLLFLSTAGCATAGNQQAEQAYQQGCRHMRNGEYEQAIEALTLAIQLAPDDVDAYKHRAEAYQAIGEIEKSIEDLDRAVEVEVILEVNNMVRWRVLAWVVMAAGCGFAGVLLSGVRGHPFLLGMLFGAVLGPLGLFVLMILPPRAGRHLLNERGPFEEEDVVDSVACPACGRMNSTHTRVCPRCETHLP